MLVDISICNRMGPRAIKDSFHAYFQSFHKIALSPEARRAVWKTFESTSGILP